MNDLISHSANTPQGNMQTPAYLTMHYQESRLFYWWYRIASPLRPKSQASFLERELFRRGRTGSQILLALYALLLISIPAGITGRNTSLITIIVGSLLALILATALNRMGMVNAAGLIVVATAIAYPTLNIMTTPGGLDMLILPLFGLLILPLVCSVSFLPEWWVFPVVLINCLFTLYALLYAPQTGELTAVLQIDFAGIITPILLVQLVVAVVAYLWVHGTVQAIKRADRAEEIARLEYDLALQAESAAQEKQRLEASIRKIVDVHTRVANGDYSARVPLTEDNVLWQISGALNNLLTRVQRSRQEMAELERVKILLHQVREENRRLTRKLGESFH
jgi:HAMP domain-containing protein